MKTDTLLPVIKSKMGDWTYFVTVMKFGKVARECRIAEEIHANQELDELIQRSIGDRVRKEMVPYLVNEKQRFYGALVVAVYGGEPEFSPVKVDEHSLIDDTDKFGYGFGLLRFDGSQTYYALDGQHRLRSIQEAIKEDPDLASEEITVIILKHENTKDGLQRTRRLFSTLNRRAKPTSSGLNIAIDEDDPIAITSRQLVKENDLLKRIVLTTLTSKQIAPGQKNDPYITTLAAFYEINEILLSAYNGGLEINQNFKQFRPSAQELDNYSDYLENLWLKMLGCCPGFGEVISGNKKPGDLRKKVDHNGIMMLDENNKPIPGGNVFCRPIGQYAIAQVVSDVGTQGKSMEDAIEAIMKHVSMDIDEKPWVNVVWNPQTKHITGGKRERTLIAAMINHALGIKVRYKVTRLPTTQPSPA